MPVLLKFLNGNKMKRAIVFLTFLITVFVVIFLLSLFLPSKVTVTKSVEIKSSIDKVKEQIINFDRWKNWYPAFKDKDVAIIKNQSPDNFNYVVLTDIKGKKTTLKLVDSTHNKIEIKVESSSSTRVSYQFILTPNKMNNQTELTWNINTQFGWYPWKRIQGVFLDKFSGDQYVAALRDLKNAAEH